MDNMITLIYTDDLKNISFISNCKKKGMNCVSVVDARSAVYVATGISAQNHSKVAVCLDAGNASRSAFSGMTEAFYRHLPIALITVGKKLDYSRELNDVVVGHYTALNYEDILYLFEKKFPMHIELLVENPKHDKVECDSVQILLSSILEHNTYLYISPSIKNIEVQYMGKVVLGGMDGCYEGAMSNVLGASLAKKRKKYIGLVSEKEFIHDINTLGNINMNELICYIVICQKNYNVIFKYARAMKFEVHQVKKEDLTLDDVKRVVFSKNKCILVLY